MDEDIKVPTNYACLQHNGEHPFFWKEGINAYITWCGDLWSRHVNYPRRK